MSIRHEQRVSVYEDIEFGPVRNWHTEGKQFVLLKRKRKGKYEFISFGEPVPIDYSGCIFARRADVTLVPDWSGIGQ